jgi:hypothetical protein
MIESAKQAVERKAQEEPAPMEPEGTESSESTNPSQSQDGGRDQAPVATEESAGSVKKEPLPSESSGEVKEPSE